MANTRIRRKSIRNKKRRNNKKKSVRRQKKVGGEIKTCENDITRCILNDNAEVNNVYNINALQKFADNHTKCNTFYSSIRNEELEAISITKKDLLDKIAYIRKEREKGYFTNANKVTKELVSNFPVIRASKECIEAELLNT